MKIGILTGGGDVPGLNPCIKAVVTRAIDEGHSVLGIRRGWHGLLNYNRDNEEDSQRWIVPLDKAAVRTVDRTGGTFLHTSRMNPGEVPPANIPAFLQNSNSPAEVPQDFTLHILQNLEHLGVEVLIPIGGDDTLYYAHRLHTEGVSIIAIPKTMDNDVHGTDYCIGFSTAITRSVDFIHDLRTNVGSHERIGIIELFGRNSGETSLISAYLADVDRAIISEVPFDPEKLSALLMEDKKQNPSDYAIMTISEGASIIGSEATKTPAQADRQKRGNIGGIGAITGDIIKKITSQNIIYQQVAYLMRSGSPDSMDLMVGFNFANMAMDLIAKKKSGRLVALRQGRYADVPADIISQGVKRVDVDELYDVDAYRPKVRHVNQKPLFLY
jgi:6-phosphofructokinase 1